MTLTSALFLQSGSEDLFNPFSGMLFFFWLAFGAIVIVGGWKMFEKAGQPGWAIIVPFYNLYTMLKVAGRPGWWLILYCIPVVNLIIMIVVAIDIAKAFGQGAAFGFFLVFLLCGIGYLILGFGDYEYQGAPAGAIV
ncbi:MAG TPA: DUF5684 domain-containing protein [Candidatus Aquilonibacter sp.]|nr:DUF5684 domain-containing protein [Candidatus Aquilonibacter sp.]